MMELDDLCRRHAHRVVAIVQRSMGKTLRRRVEPADIAQEVMVEVIRYVPRRRFPSEAAFLGWLSTVAAHAVAQEARRCRPLPGLQVPIGSGLDLADPCGEEACQISIRNERAEKVMTEISTLPPLDREVLISRVLRGMEWRMVAMRVGSTSCAAQMRLQRIRRRLAGALRRSGVRGSWG